MIDAHNHLHDPALNEVRDDVLASTDIRMHVVNGTCEADWRAVASLAAASKKVLPAFGLHPWNIASASDSWLQDLERFLIRYPNAAVGEIGLDRWIKDHDLEAQSEAFCAQLAVAARLERAAVIHCLKAWGRLIDDLARTGPPCRGFLSHAFAGSREVASQLIDHGGYFSFSGYFLNARKSEIRELYAWLPLERLLVETDAPHMSLPHDYACVQLLANGQNHPGNLKLTYHALAQLRGIPVEKLIEAVAATFHRLFGVGPSV